MCIMTHCAPGLDIILNKIKKHIIVVSLTKLIKINLKQCDLLF